ncbi:hypothetical protein C8R45DRAFT_1007730 [Mycena sanguinolenta]|nr:hypothetical protein C8R45DRAFT_1007730 [Mycena sanguinolenta]
MSDQGATGGFGHGARITTALVARETLDNTRLPTTSAAEFCKTYGFSETLKEKVLDSGYEQAVDLLFAEDLGAEEYGFNIGQVAELSWALAHMLLKNKTVSAVNLIREGDNKPDLIGGIGGIGGTGRKGGIGGDGMGPRVPLTGVHRFRSIGGGIGGPGGSSNPDSGAIRANGQSHAPNSANKEPKKIIDSSHLPDTLYGGEGGPGADHPEHGGIGGGGGGPVLSIKAVGHFLRIQGGKGGPGGNADNQGGQGGAGYAPVFSELLCIIDTKTRIRVSNLNVKLVDLKDQDAKFSISLDLNKRLQDCGFETVCGLFHVQENDLPDPTFKIGHKSALKRALSVFVQNPK